MNDVLAESLDEFETLTEAYEVFRAVEVVIGGEQYRIEIHRGKHKPGSQCFSARSWTEKTVSETPERMTAWVHESIPSQDYADADSALHGTLRYFADVAEARRAKRKS